MKLNRFKPWENKLELKDSESIKITDIKQHVSRIEFKDDQPIEKVFDCRVLQKKRFVTKGYIERKKVNPTFGAFGCGSGNENLRMNATITMVQRDNIWHPHYEIKVDDEDLGSKFRARQTLNAAKPTEVGITNIQQEIEQLLQQGRTEEQKQIVGEGNNKEMEPTGKRIFDMKKIEERLIKMGEERVQEKVVDPKAVRLDVLPQFMTEEEVVAVMEKKYGKIDRIKIPIDEQRGRIRGFAIIGFMNASSAQRAIEDEEVIIDMASLSIKEAHYSMHPRGGGGDRNRDAGGLEGKAAFGILQRRKY